MRNDELVDLADRYAWALQGECALVNLITG